MELAEDRRFCQIATAAGYNNSMKMIMMTLLVLQS